MSGAGRRGAGDDAFADRAAALLGDLDGGHADPDGNGDGRSFADERFAPGADEESRDEGSRDEESRAEEFGDDPTATTGLVPDLDVDLESVPPTSWVDPIAEAEAERQAEEAAIDAEIARTAKPVRDTRGRKRKEWRQTERARRYAARRSVRFPIFTRSILLWMLIFAIAGLTFGASGAFWWAQFNTQITQLKEDTRDFEQRSQNAQAQIDAERNQALTQIKEANKPLAGFLSEALIVQLAKNFEDKVWYVSTLDNEGRDINGSAFAVVSGDDETLMVTSYNTVRAAAINPAPEIHVLEANGTDDVVADLWAWDEATDLALLRVPRGNLQVLPWAPSDAQANLIGSRVFAISGYGGNGATLSPGLVIDTSAFGIRHDGALDTDFQGGPMIAADGTVVAVSSIAYKPGNFAVSELKFAPLIDTVCVTVMDCGGGQKKKRDQPDVKASAPPPGAQD